MAVFILGDHVRTAKIPAQDAFIDILLRQGEGKFTADCFAGRQAFQANHTCLVREGVLILLRILVHQSDAAVFELLYQPLHRLFFLSIQLFDGENAFFDEQLDQCVKKRSRFQGFAGVGVDAGVCIH